MQDTLTNLLSLQTQLRKQKSIKEVSFFIAHQTHLFFRYKRAFVWSCLDSQFINIESISGSIELEKNSPFQQTLVTLIYKLIKHKTLLKSEQPFIIDRNDIEKMYLNPLPDFLPSTFVFSAFYHKTTLVGGCCFCLDKHPTETQIQKLNFLLDAYEHSFSLLSHQYHSYKRYFHFSNSRYFLSFFALSVILALFIIRIPMSVMVEAEISPKNPTVITAPMDGVIKRIAVHSSQLVKPNDPLFFMETRDLTNALEQAEKEYLVATERLKKGIRNSFNDRSLRAEINVLEAEKKEKALTVQYTKKILNNATVRAKKKAIVIINSPNEWTGKPVKIGEKIMETSQENNVEVTLWLPVSDALYFEKGDPITLYLNAAPLSPYFASIEHSNYLAEKTPKNILAYKLTARLAPIKGTKKTPRLGSQGYARITHGTSTLFFYLFRRPITYLRQTLGW